MQSINIITQHFDFRFIYLKNPDIFKYWDITCKWRTGPLQSSTLLWQKRGHECIYLRHIIRQSMSSTGSGTTDRNHDVDSTDEADNKSQLNLALEKSISGCWAMNLQTHKSHHSKMKSGFDFFFVLLNYVSNCFLLKNFIIIVHITKEFWLS